MKTERMDKLQPVWGLGAITHSQPLAKPWDQFAERFGDDSAVLNWGHITMPLSFGEANPVLHATPAAKCGADAYAVTFAEHLHPPRRTGGAWWRPAVQQTLPLWGYGPTPADLVAIMAASYVPHPRSTT
jgi:hypothetical protein